MRRSPRCAAADWHVELRWDVASEQRMWSRSTISTNFMDKSLHSAENLQLTTMHARQRKSFANHADFSSLTSPRHSSLRASQHLPRQRSGQVKDIGASQCSSIDRSFPSRREEHNSSREAARTMERQWGKRRKRKSVTFGGSYKSLFGHDSWWRRVWGGKHAGLFVSCCAFSRKASICFDLFSHLTLNPWRWSGTAHLGIVSIFLNLIDKLHISTFSGLIAHRVERGTESQGKSLSTCKPCWKLGKKRKMFLKKFWIRSKPDHTPNATRHWKFSARPHPCNYRRSERRFAHLAFLEVVVQGELELAQIHFFFLFAAAFVVFHVALEFFQVRLNLRRRKRELGATKPTARISPLLSLRKFFLKLWCRNDSRERERGWMIWRV